MRRRLIHPASWAVMIVLLGALVLAPRWLPRFHIYLLSLILVTGLLAMSLNLVLGFGGMYQFHHAVFYGVGAYTFALMLEKTTAAPVWSFLAAPVVSGLISLVMGIICIRLSKLYFGMLQLSLGSLVWAIVYRWYSFTGGDDGIHGIPLPDAISGTSNAYYFVLAVAVVCLILMFLLVNSPFGRIFQAIRDNPERSAAIGVNVRRHQLAGLVLAGSFAGVCGALFVVVEGSVFPDLLFWTFSLEILVMCLLGGWFTFFGPMLGAGIMVALRTLVGIYTEYWTFVLGIILMLLIFFLPEGVLGFIVGKMTGRGEAAKAGEA